MYCPVDGDEFREGITRCPEHDVDLVEEPPDLGEPPPGWTDRFNDRTAVKISFWVFVAAAVVYSLTGLTTAVMLLLTEVGERETFDTAVFFQRINSAMFPVGIGLLGILVGALVVRTYLTLSTGRHDAPSSSSPNAMAQGPLSSALARFLFAMTVMFALVWLATGILIAQEQAEDQSSPVFSDERDEPSESFVTLSALHHVAYLGGVVSLSIMGAGLIVRTYVRSDRADENEDQDDF